MEEKSARDSNEEIIQKLKNLNFVLNKIIEVCQIHETKFSTSHKPRN
jgi:hypothetical protein